MAGRGDDVHGKIALSENIIGLNGSRFAVLGIRALKQLLIRRSAPGQLVVLLTAHIPWPLWVPLP